MSRAIGVLRFPGTNCDRDVFEAVEQVHQKAEWLWHADRFDFRQYEALILPGGFSYGDYLRSGALAAKSPAMKSVSEAAENGVPILGICNGFQILCEAGLLPGVLIRNQARRFRDEWVKLVLVHQHEKFANDVAKNQSLTLPIAHGDGRYYIDPNGLKDLYHHEQIWWKYEINPNGSVDDIAGVMNRNKNVAGLMPHPERAIFDWMGSCAGRGFFLI